MSEQTRQDATSYALIPGAGSAGLVWTQVRDALDATVLPVPDESDVPAMAAALGDSVRRMPAPRVLAGASLGAMVALEVARTVEVDALVLIAAGFGIEVSDSVLDWVAAAPEDLFAKFAAVTLADRGNDRLVDTITEDFAGRGQPVLLRHLKALAAYTPKPLPEPPPTLVLWGEQDRSVPLDDHVELAVRCRGALVPLRGAAHVPFLEQPRDTVRWIRAAAQLARTTPDQERSGR